MIFILVTIVNSQTINSCGYDCEYSIIDDKLMIEVNGDIMKTNWDDYKEIITSISIEGNLYEFPNGFIHQFPSLHFF